ncbi:MAG: hypothetical protein K0U39_04480 [Alphaproteobacteria bacterium]|nr:hypothetical protein [Alphaproteobacteria bacterium]
MRFNKKIYAKKIYVGIIFAVFGFYYNAPENAQANEQANEPANEQKDKTCVVVLDKNSFTDLDAIRQSLESLNQCLGETGKKLISTENLLEIKGRFNKLQQKYNIPEADFNKIVQLLEAHEPTEKTIAQIKKLLQKYGIILSEEETESLLEDL